MVNSKNTLIQQFDTTQVLELGIELNIPSVFKTLETALTSVSHAQKIAKTFSDTLSCEVDNMCAVLEIVSKVYAKGDQLNEFYIEQTDFNCRSSDSDVFQPYTQIDKCIDAIADNVYQYVNEYSMLQARMSTLKSKPILNEQEFSELLGIVIPFKTAYIRLDRIIRNLDIIDNCFQRVSDAAETKISESVVLQTVFNAHDMYKTEKNKVLDQLKYQIFNVMMFLSTIDAYRSEKTSLDSEGHIGGNPFVELNKTLELK